MPFKDPEKKKAYERSERRQEKQKAYHRLWREVNRERNLAKKKIDYKANCQAYKDRAKLWKEKNPDKARASSKVTYQRYREQRLAAQKAYRKEFPEKKRATTAKYRRANPDKVQAQKYRWVLRRLKENPAFKIQRRLRNHLRRFVKHRNRSKGTMHLLGCDLDWLMAWFEVQFQPGMTWENYGSVWHIDHIKPCARFDLTDHLQQKRCFHWTNLQPLFAVENIRKGARYKEVV